MVSASLLKNTVEFLQGKIECLEVYQHVHGLVKQLTDSDGNLYPACYVGSGKYKPLEYSQSAGMIYFRKNGDITFEELEGAIPCDRIVEYSIPLKAVSFIRTDKIGTDDIYFDDRLAQSLDAIITQKGLKNATGSMQASIQVESYSTDRTAIVDSEYEGNKFKDINYSWSYLSMNLIAKIKVDRNCQDDLCYADSYCYNGVTITCAAGSGRKYLIRYTSAGLDTYVISALNGKTIVSIQYGNFMLAPDQWSLSGSNLTFLDSGHGNPDITFPIEANVYIRIEYE